MVPCNDQIDRTLKVLEATPNWATLCDLWPDIDIETAAAILDAGGAISTDILQPMDSLADQVGCRLENGRVKTPEPFAAAYRTFAEGGWIGLDLPEEQGGSGLPLTLHAAAAPLFDRGCPAFNMAAGASRSGAILLNQAASPELAKEWVKNLISGEWSATICMSEPDAGSDVGRIRTRATKMGNSWRISGQKIWISFGDHDMVSRIGHCMLARTSDAAGTRGLSLFLVPSTTNSGDPNGIEVLRLEEKMGLHGSPTCALSFENAEGILLGEENRGLAQLFTMMELMRLQTGCQGLGIASRACDIAEQYAEERKQGGDPKQPPVALITHPDVRRQLRNMRADTELLRVAVIELATTLDIAERTEDEALRAENKAFAAWMLPLIKTFGAETGFNVANAGIQVLGGAGYTSEWPLEQMVRDARVFSIYEGTTGMQAIDFLTRRLLRDRTGFDVFLKRCRDEAGQNPVANDLFERLEQLAAYLSDNADNRDMLFIADAWMRAGWLAVSVWLGLRLLDIDPVSAKQIFAQVSERFAVFEAEVRTL